MKYPPVKTKLTLKVNSLNELLINLLKREKEIFEGHDPNSKKIVRIEIVTFEENEDSEIKKIKGELAQVKKQLNELVSRAKERLNNDEITDNSQVNNDDYNEYTNTLANTLANTVQNEDPKDSLGNNSFFKSVFESK